MDEHIETSKKIIENGGCRDMPLICHGCPLDKSCKVISDSVRAAKQYLKENNMNDWKELDINNLPHDILVGEYEFEYPLGPEWLPCKNQDYQGRIDMLKSKTTNIRYHKVQPKTPSHTEIMTKWWLCWDNEWIQVGSYRNGGYFINRHIRTVNLDVESYRNGRYLIDQHTRAVNLDVDKSWFIGRESADVPPEK